MAASKRDHLVNVALDLFCRNGFHATGIDTIVAEAGVAKMTLYKHFQSKEDLVVATLELQDRRWREWLAAAVERRATKPADRLLAIFEALHDWIQSDQFCGCAFTKASGELSSHTEAVREMVVRSQQMVRSYIHGLAADAGAADADQLADQLLLLLAGVQISAQMTGRADGARHAAQACRVLLRDAIAKAG